MTMTRNDKLKNGDQEKGFRNFHGNFDLNVTAPELEEQPDVQCQVIENHNSQFSELLGRMKNHKDNDSVDAQQCGEHVHQTKIVDGCVDHLFILAQSAEIVAQSENGVAGMNTYQNKDLHNNLVGQMSRGYSSNITSDDQEYSRELLHSSSVDSPLSGKGCGFRNEVTRPCLTQILKQAGCEYLIMDQEKCGDKQCKSLHGKTIRLSQIKDQARCKSKKDLSPQKMINGPRNEQPKGRILRLSQIKHQARSKGNATVKEGTEEHIGGSLHCNMFKDNKEKVVASRLLEEVICLGDSSLSKVEGAPAHNISRGASQSSVGYLAQNIVRRLQSRSHQFSAVKRDDENIRECQRTARQLRAFKIKKQRQESRTDCIGSSANMGLYDMKMGQIGLTSINNFLWLSHNATSLKDKKLIACHQELPKASSCNEKLRANFGIEKLQGHLGSIESLGVRCTSVMHIPNGLPVQNSGLPYNIFQQYDNYMGWMSYMHHMQLKENYRVVARQHRAVRIQEKRVLKDKQQNSENPVQAANSGAQKEFMPVKRLRLTQLRREVRLGNQRHSVIQGPVEN